MFPLLVSRIITFLYQCKTTEIARFSSFLSYAFPAMGYVKKGSYIQTPVSNYP